MCDHVTSGQLHYDRQLKRLVHRIICDDCHAVLKSVLGESYQPNPKLGTIAQPGRALA